MNKAPINISTSTFVKFWLVLVGLVLLGALVWLARDAVIMLLIAVFLALVLNRPTDFFAKKLPKHSRSLAASIVFFITFVVLIGVVVLVVPVFIEQSIVFAKSLPDTVSALAGQYESVLEFFKANGLEETISSVANNLSSELSNIASSIGAGSVDMISNFFSGVMNAFLVLIMTFFMLIEGPKWLEKFWKFAYRDDKKRQHHQEVANQMYNVISTFVTSQFIIAALNAFLAGIGVFILALSFGFTMSLILPIASVVFITTFIPVLGPFIGGFITGLLILLYNPIAAIIFIVYLILFQQVVYNLISPRIQGKRMNMSAGAVLIAMIVGLQVGGVFGALVAIPIAGCLLILIRESYNYYKSRTSSKPKKKLAK